MPKVKFIQEKLEIEVAAGANLRDAGIKAGINFYSGPDQYLNCRGNGLCATCSVWLKNDTAKNASPLGVMERTRRALGFYAIGHEDECRLSCQVRVMGDLEVWTRPGFNWFGETLAETKPAAVSAPAAPAKPAAPAPVAAAAAPAPPAK